MSLEQQPKHHFIFNIKRRDRGAYRSDPRLSVQTPDGVEELPEEIKAITPRMEVERRQGDIVTWMAGAGQHNDLEWYREQLEERGLQVEFFNEDQNRMTVAKPLSS